MEVRPQKKRAWYQVIDSTGRKVPGLYEKPRAEEIAEERRAKAEKPEHVRVEFAEASHH